MGWVIRLGLITRLTPDKVNCPVLVKGIALPPPAANVTPAIPPIAALIGAVTIPVANATVLPAGSNPLSTAMSRVAVVVVSTFATTCAGKTLGRRATRSSKGLSQLDLEAVVTEPVGAGSTDA